jgi:hypothetical protein
MTSLNLRKIKAPLKIQEEIRMESKVQGEAKTLKREMKEANLE